MPRGEKDKYTDKQKRQAEHIEEGYKERGVSEDEAERRAWATVNAVHGGGEKPGGGGYGKGESHEPMRRGGRIVGRRSSPSGSASRTVDLATVVQAAAPGAAACTKLRHVFRRMPPPPPQM